MGSEDFSIWVDADACPREVREILARAAERLGVRTIFVANTPLPLPPHRRIEFRLAPGGFNAADDYIVARAGPGDLAVTDDIPLASRLIGRGVPALNARGDELTSANIGERLAMRNLMGELRQAGLAVGGTKDYTAADVRRFANALDRILTRRLKARR